MEEVSTHAFRGRHSRCDIRPIERLWRGQKLLLEIVRQLHLATHSLLRETFLNEPVVLERCTHLTRDRREKLLVARCKGLGAQPPEEVDHTDDSRFARTPAIADGNRYVCRGPPRERLAQVSPAADQGTSLSENS